MNHFRSKINTPLHKQGSALIAIIAAIAIFSVLAATLMTLTSTSEIQTAVGHWADQAFYMAESGYRYAKTQYQSASESAKMTVFDTIDDNSPYSVHNTDSSFSLETFSYFFVVEENTAIAEPFTVKVHSPGGFPYDNLGNFQNQKIQIEETVLTIQSCVTAEGAGNHTLTLLSPSGPNLSDPLPAGTILLPVIESSTSQTINSGGNISIPDGLSNLFPLYNGRIRVAGRTLTYRIKDQTNNILSDVVDVNGSVFTNLSIASGSKILLLPFVNINSTGIVGQDSNSVHRTVNYYSPLPIGYTETYSDTFSGDTSILKATTDSDGAVTMEIGSVGEDSNKVFKVTGSIDSESHGYLDVEGNTVARNAQEAFNDFRNSTGGYLSYDAQTKVGFYSDSVFDPDFIENVDLATGLSFRIRSESYNETAVFNMYGLSFFNKENAVAGTILDDIAPPGLSVHEPAIVLWQQTFDSVATSYHRTWLAYKRLAATIYSQNFNSGLGGWTNEGTGVWGIEDNALVVNSYDPSIAQSPIIHIPEEGQDTHSKVSLTFWSSIQFIDPIDVHSFARREVRIVQDGTIENIPVNSPESVPGGYRVTADIPSKYIGKDIMIQFYFDRESGNGWSVDDISLVSKSPIQNSTLLVRLKEAAVIPFNYNESETLTFNKGDRIFGAGGANGRLIVPPILTSSNDPIGGYLLLNSVSSEWFEENEALTAWGKGSIAIVDGAPSAEKYRRANIIKVYFATEAGLNDPTPDNSSPLDCYTNAYGRLNDADLFQWPVQEGTEWTSNRDYFQIIQWDGINESDDTLNTDETLFDTLIDTYSGVPKDKTIIISHNTKLQSVDIDATSPELGLHAIGDAAASYVDHVYFDDFGFQLYLLPNALFPDAFQQ